MPNDELYKRLATPPQDALKTIGGGRLKGLTDINPQWRYERMTEEFGSCGVGGRFEIPKLWTEPGDRGEVCAFALVLLQIKVGDEWSDPIPGVGGSKLVAAEKDGPHTSDECYKMAVTDALGTAMKMIGVAADIYRGTTRDSKYREPPRPKSKPQSKPAPADDSRPIPTVEMGGDWRKVLVHFGKNAGTPLGELSERSLGWYIEHVDPYHFQDGSEKQPRQEDLALRAALDKALSEMHADQQDTPAQNPHDDGDNIPF